MYMKFFRFGIDGGKNSGVIGFWICEIKWLFSIVILNFKKNSRENYHSHAFNAYTFFIFGEVEEELLNGEKKIWKPSLIPKYTAKDNFHKVKTLKECWCISFRGPWINYWYEYSPKNKEYILLTNGRKILNKFKNI